MPENSVYVDTNILIYLLEGHKDYGQDIANTLDRLSKEGHSFSTSVITITEFLAGTTATSTDVLQSVPKLTFKVLDETLAEKAAILQRENKVHIGDAIHLATALGQGSKYFFTNDKPFAKFVKRYLPVLEVNG